MIVLGPAQLPLHGKVDQFISVSVTTIYEGLPHDPACVLMLGDHPFIKHPSYVTYRHARVDQDRHMAMMVDSGTWKPNSPCCPETIKKIVQGVCRSKLVSREIKQFMGCI